MVNWAVTDEDVSVCCSVVTDGLPFITALHPVSAVPL